MKKFLLIIPFLFAKAPVNPQNPNLEDFNIQGSVPGIVKATVPKQVLFSHIVERFPARTPQMSPNLANFGNFVDLRTCYPVNRDTYEQHLKLFIIGILEDKPSENSIFKVFFGKRIEAFVFIANHEELDKCITNVESILKEYRADLSSHKEKAFNVSDDVKSSIQKIIDDFINKQQKNLDEVLSQKNSAKLVEFLRGSFNMFFESELVEKIRQSKTLPGNFVENCVKNYTDISGIQAMLVLDQLSNVTQKVEG